MEPLDLVSVVVRAMAFIVALQAAGLAWFVPAHGRTEASVSSAVNPLLRTSALFGVLLVLTHRALDAGRLAGEWSGILDPHLQGMVWGRRPGLSSAVCAVGLLALAVSTSKVMRRSHFVGPAGALCVAASFPLTGHTTEALHAPALQLLVAVHVGLAAYWIGAVIALYRLTYQTDVDGLTWATTRFSSTAVWLVPLILPVGVLLTWGLLPNVAALRTPYGGFLLAKGLGFAVLILLAARNRLKVLPAMVAGESGAIQMFRRTLVAEYVVLCGVLAATATMTSLFSWH